MDDRTERLNALRQRLLAVTAEAGENPSEVTIGDVITVLAHVTGEVTTASVETGELEPDDATRCVSRGLEKGNRTALELIERAQQATEH